MARDALSTPEFDALLAPLSPTSRMAVAVSGGRDSTALVLLLARWRDWLVEQGRLVPQIFVLTVDHGLRANSRAEACEVEHLARGLDLPHTILEWEDDKPAVVPQATARDARYRLLFEWMRAHDVPDLMLAHHLDDQAETFLMRLQRGSGLDGLAGMRPIARRGGVRLLRPLLTVPRARLTSTLEAAGQGWLDDPSNEDDQYQRVRVRKLAAVFDTLGLPAGRLAAVAEKMARARSALEYGVDTLIAAGVLRHESGFCLLNRDVWAAAPEETGLRGLARLLKAIGGHDHPPRQEKLGGLYSRFIDGRLNGACTLAGCQLRVRREGVVLLRERAAVRDCVIPIPNDQPVVWDRRFEVMQTGETRFCEIRPLGERGYRMLRDRGMELPGGLLRAALETSPSIWCEDQVIAAPLVGAAKPVVGAAKPVVGAAKSGLSCVTAAPIWDSSLRMAAIYQVM